ncbi:LuxR family transcriptional regulator [Beijerinckia sp. L45]|uniref:helix-turn-helix transcriptional regulator n=1 Tax=Beijerinckia sp. L45 TaxID=1641855 RepID=UPI00131C05D0|nr:LuxR family transcriptional regulator [Beijerinckia sp. L45]
MALHFEDFLESTQSITDAGTLIARFHAAVVDEGFENLVFVLAGGRQPLEILSAELPPGYADLYQQKKWERVDPVLRHSRIARQPFAWSSVVGQAGESAQEKRFFAECQSIGVHGGVTMPFHHPDGRTHVMSVSLRGGVQPDPRRIPYLYALAAQTWIRHCALVSGSTSTQIHLTSRERECLVWAKDGKTNWEISQILSVAERTVEFHMANVMQKLNATNRVTAIVIALQEGLIKM